MSVCGREGSCAAAPSSPVCVGVCWGRVGLDVHACVPRGLRTAVSAVEGALL